MLKHEFNHPYQIIYHNTLTSKNIKTVYKQLPQIEKKLRSMSEILLANLVMVGEIPAPSFREERKVQFILDRFNEAGSYRMFNG
jgi:hypothetical protein